jgi:hypothetical protein
MEYNTSGKRDTYDAETFGFSKSGFAFTGYWRLYADAKPTNVLFEQNTDYDPIRYSSYWTPGDTVATHHGISCYLYAEWTPTLTVRLYGNGATYGTYQGTTITNPGGYLGTVNDQVLRYDTNYENGLANIQNPSWLYLKRIGYSKTGYWLYGNNRCNETPSVQGYPNGMTGQQIAEAFGVYVDNNTSPGTINIYA